MLCGVYFTVNNLQWTFAKMTSAQVIDYVWYYKTVLAVKVIVEHTEMADHGKIIDLCLWHYMKLLLWFFIITWKVSIICNDIKIKFTIAVTSNSLQ